MIAKCSMPYPDRAIHGLHRVEQWIDAYWRTGNIILDGLDGAILKLTEGGPGYFASKKAWAQEQVRRVQEKGLGLQFYHYGRPDSKGTEQDAKEEARSFLDAIGELVDPMTLYYQDGSEAAVWLDLESDAPNLSEKEGLAWILTFCQELESNGFPVGIYSSAEWLAQYATGDRWKDTERLFTREADGGFRPIWQARYGNSPTAYPPALNKYPPSTKTPNALLCMRGTPPIIQWTSSRIGGTEDGRGHDSNLVYLR